MASQSADVVVVGAGPAGWSLACACATRGLDTLLVAPRPDAVWRPTYALWADQRGTLPQGAESVVASTVWAAGRKLARAYAVLDNASLLAAYRDSAVRVVPGTVESASRDADRMTVRLRSGERLFGRVVVDASGERRVLSGGPAPGARAEQTAYGVVVPTVVAAPLVSAGEAVFMDWGVPDGWPTFLYAVPLTGDRVLLEQTSLARRPGLPLTCLEEQLNARLSAAGISREHVLRTEKVRFAVDLPVPQPRPGVVAFGVAGGLMHPATGYSVGDALTLAPAVADALAADLGRGAVAAAEAARAVVWSPAARGVRLLRDLGLRMLIGLPPARVPEFFDAFFSLSPDLQRAYLSGREDLRGTAAAMTGVFGGASWQVRRAMVRSQIRSSPGRGGPARAGGARSPGW